MRNEIGAIDVCLCGAVGWSWAGHSPAVWWLGQVPPSPHLKNGESGFCLALSWDRRIPRKSVDHCALYVVIWHPVFRQCEHHCKVIKTHPGRLKGALVATSHGSDYLQVHWHFGDLSVESPPSSSAQATHPPLLDLPHKWVVSRVAWDTPTKISTTSFSELLWLLYIFK